MPVIEYFKKDGRAILVDSTAPIEKVYQTTRQQIVDLNLGKAGALPPIGSAATKSRPVSNAGAGIRGKAWKNIVFVLGGPGCGKGTQCERIAKEFNYNHLSAGDLLRAEVATGSARAKELDAIMKEGKIVPMSVTLGLLKEAMEKAGEASGFLIDGFPRALDQALAFEDTIAQCKFVLMFDAPENVLEQRLLKRGETSGRADDNIGTIKKRFKTFIETSMPVINHYDKIGKCVKISSVAPPDVVYKNTRVHFVERGYPNIIMVLGGPGSGKGTQCVRLAKEFSLTHLSTGDLLRAEVEKKSAIGKQCADLMKEGKIVPMGVILGLLKSAIEANQNTPGFLIDGFPRAMHQAIEFEKTICPANKVLFFNCPLNILEARLLERGKTSGRADDNIDTIRKRFKTFQEESMPVVGHFGSRVLRIESTGTIDQVYNTVRNSLVSEGVLKPIPNLIFVLGGPGSGKGTQCERLAKEFRLTHLSTGDLLRAELDKGSEIGKKCGNLMKEGKIVPMDIILGLLKTAIENTTDTPGFLIDGFPRAMDQAIEFEKTICPAKKVLFFNCPLPTLEARLLERGKTSGRADDNIETIRKRFKTFQEESMPVVGHFGSRVMKIESTGTVNEVYTNVKRNLIAEGIVKPDPNIIFVLGGPGSGKGTQCERLAKEFNLTHLSTGDLLRAELQKGSEIGKRCGDLMKEGKIVPMETILGLLKTAIEGTAGNTPGFLIDGFPRAMDQAIEFEKTIFPAKKVLFFNCPLDILEKRLIERGKTSGRADDNIETIRKRFKTFQQESMPVVGHFGKRVLKIESTGTVDQVYADLKQNLISEGVVKPIPNIIFVLGGPGSGKGTQCERLAKEFNLTHLSTGDLLRAELQKGSDIGKKCGDLMKEGKIVPMDVILGLLKNAIEQSPESTPGFLIDGFPRAMNQAIEFEKTIFPAKKVLFFNCPLDTLEKRLIERGKTSGRADDNIDTIRKRFKTFQEESMPVVGHFGPRVLKIESTGTVDQVYSDLKRGLLSEGVIKPIPNIIFVLGGPGSGKGTQCARLAKEYRLTHLSTGDLLRAELDKGSDIGKKCGNLMKEGKIVPMDIILGLLKAAINNSPENTPGFLIDGFPRAMDQAIEFEKTIFPAKKVLFFNCPLDTLEARLLERGKTSGRADDNIETIRKRFKTFQEESMPVVGHFGSRVLKIESTGTVDQVYADLKKGLLSDGTIKPDPNIVFVLGGPGSGKGTQCVRLAKEFRLTHLSTGDLLRAELDKGSDIGKKCGDLMKEGKIVPMAIILGLLKSAISNSSESTPGFLIDGFPRAMDQAIEFERTICPAKKVLFFNCPLETLEARLIERGKTSGRADDNIDTIRKRFQTFQNESLPVVGHFGGRVLKIESTGTVDQVYTDVKTSLIGEGIVRSDPNIIFVLGGPGSGKGTQCVRLAKEFHLTHLSTGDLLRAELDKGSEIGKKCGDLMKEGKIVPMSIILGLLKSAIWENLNTPGFLIDGFPRARDQALEFEKTICPAKKVLFFNCPLPVLESRLLERGKTSGRADDNIETIRKRFKTFEEESMPVVSLFEDRVMRIESTGTVDEVYQTVKDGLLSSKTIKELPFEGSNIVFVLGGPGSGKGTQCDKLVESLNYAHLSTGDLLRDEVKRGTPLGAQLEEIMKEGKMVPLEITLRLLVDAMHLAKDSAPGYLIDGFPRTMEQAIEYHWPL
ncbi:adenylate kinase-domain-containing protein [Obelidium mucronatum]|nr:adenylate kinase-domain-containing protein [Obelidium mucronatum]